MSFARTTVYSEHRDRNLLVKLQFFGMWPFWTVFLTTGTTMPNCVLPEIYAPGENIRQEKTFLRACVFAGKVVLQDTEHAGTNIS